MEVKKKIIKLWSYDSDCTGWASASGTGVCAAQMEELIIENQHVTFKIHWNSAWGVADFTVMRKWKFVCVWVVVNVGAQFLVQQKYISHARMRQMTECATFTL